MNTQARKKVTPKRLWITVTVLTLLAASSLVAYTWNRSPLTKTGYQCVLLSNGQVYFGKLKNLGAPFPILEDVHYVHVEPTDAKGDVKNILLKRGVSEWHNPDNMQINGSQIVLVEPVAEGSIVAQRIAELRKEQPATSPVK